MLVAENKGKVNKLSSNQDVEEIKKIEADLLGQKIEGKKLRVDSNFY